MPLKRKQIDLLETTIKSLKLKAAQADAYSLKAYMEKVLTDHSLKK